MMASTTLVRDISNSPGSPTLVRDVVLLLAARVLLVSDLTSSMLLILHLSHSSNTEPTMFPPPGLCSHLLSWNVFLIGSLHSSSHFFWHLGQCFLLGRNLPGKLPCDLPLPSSVHSLYYPGVYLHYYQLAILLSVQVLEVRELCVPGFPLHCISCN